VIELASDPYIEFVNFLNSKKFTNVPCKIVFLPQHITVGENGGDQENIGFAMYDSIEHIIYIPCGMEQWKNAAKEQFGMEGTEEDIYPEILHNIAHEYKHHLQTLDGQIVCDEGEADDFGIEMVDEFLEVFGQ
jgi:hypothetical protein